MVEHKITRSMRDLEGYFTPEQVHSMIKHAPTERDKLIFLILWRTGRRVGEVVLMKKGDIDFYKGMILWNILKKRQTTEPYRKWKPCDSHLLEQLKTYTEPLLPDEYVFPSPYVPLKHLSTRQIQSIVKDTAFKCGIFKVGGKSPHPHNFRHSFSVHFVRSQPHNSMALKTLQMILEHSNIGITANTYQQFSQEDIREQLEEVFKNDKMG